MKTIIMKCTSGLITLVLFGCTHTGWEDRLESELPAFGHRNWIVVADAAYPKQSAPGIETIHTGADQLEVVDAVLQTIKGAPHVQGFVMLDSELAHVPESAAPGIDAYRQELEMRLAGTQVKTMPHEEIIALLDADSKTFNVLLLKTDLTIPYTSVFIQLDCGYWNAEKETLLRTILKESTAP